MQDVVRDLQSLPRRWWFCPVPGLEGRTGTDGGTYWGYPLDLQPRIADADPELSWLVQQPPVSDWGLDTGDAQPQRRLLPAELLSVLDGAPAPQALSRLADHPELQKRLRSFTGCYIDLGDRLVATSRDVRLLHFVSDQQWVRHWLIAISPGQHSGPVVTTQMPLGFDGEDAIPSVVPVDGSVDLDLAADSTEEFLYRFWIENEIAFRLSDAAPLTEPFSSYVAALPA